ncbi:MAG: diphosphate--fructose-6-phosphate 1-phosphotransferase [Anaerolineae bacterium]|nr:diphosphate--fructose-6-phosphate 1-phosphotransferase [Anaerolineae bacterium]
MNALVLQTGGPTAVFNASLGGVIETWQRAGVGRLWGARRGLKGLVGGEWVELTQYHDRPEAPLASQPGAALGAGRDRLSDEDLPAALDGLARWGIGAVFILGGNGSMAAAHRLAEGARAAGYQANGQPLRVVGVPKTVDNDLAGTDFAPGFPSAARCLAQTVLDIGLDLRSMAGFDQVAVVEVMGRHAGWLAAATALARANPAHPPHLILMPEIPLDENAWLAAVQSQVEQGGVCLVAASEGVRDLAGNFLTEKGGSLQRDGSGQRMLGFGAGVASYLARLVGERLGLRCRQMRLDTVQRSSRTLVSAVDRACAFAAGEAAVQVALAGQSDIMMGLVRSTGEPHAARAAQQGSIQWGVAPVSLREIVGHERCFPAEWLAPPFDIAPTYLDYLRPLVDGWQPDGFDLLS